MHPKSDFALFQSQMLHQKPQITPTLITVGNWAFCDSSSALECGSVHSAASMPWKCFGKETRRGGLHTLAAQGVAAAQPVVVCPALVAASALHVVLAGAAPRDRAQRGVRAALARSFVQGALGVTAACYTHGQGHTQKQHMYM